MSSGQGGIVQGTFDRRLSVLVLGQRWTSGFAVTAEAVPTNLYLSITTDRTLALVEDFLREQLIGEAEKMRSREGILEAGLEAVKLAATLDERFTGLAQNGGEVRQAVVHGYAAPERIVRPKKDAENYFIPIPGTG